MSPLRLRPEMLGKLRASAKLTQKELAAEAGVSRAMINRIERGHAENVTFRTINKIAHTLRVGVNTFVTVRPSAYEILCRDEVAEDRDRERAEAHPEIFRRLLDYFKGLDYFDGDVRAASRAVSGTILPALLAAKAEIDSLRRAQAAALTRPSRYATLARAGNKCEACGAKASEARLEIDHIRPVSWDGPSDISNLQVLCHNCNSSKSNHFEIDHREAAP